MAVSEDALADVERLCEERAHPYERLEPSSEVRRQLAEIDADPTGIFQG